MSVIGWIVFGLAATVPFVPLLLRERTARNAVARMSRAANGLWREAEAKGLQDDDRVARWHDAVITLAAVAPHVAGGLLDLHVVQGIRRVPPTEVEARTIQGIEWIQPYLTTCFASLAALEFFGFPYDCRRWLPAGFFAALLLFEDPQGAVDIALVRQAGADAAIRIARARERAELASLRGYPRVVRV